MEDAERMFSPRLLKFMENKGYQYEAEYIRAVLGWRQSCDMGGFHSCRDARKTTKFPIKGVNALGH